MNEFEISKIIVDSAIEVHRALGGPGPLESVYEYAFAREIQRKGLVVERRRELPVVYKGIRLPVLLRLHLVVENW
jgi:GxxExxY protein